MEPCPHTSTALPPRQPLASRGPLLMASEHLPDTWGDAAPSLLRPPGPPETSHCPRGPGRAVALLYSPCSSPRGAVASAPGRLHSQPNPSDRKRLDKLQGDKWRGAGRAGGGRLLRTFRFGHCPPVTGWENDILVRERARSQGGVKKKKKKKKETSPRRIELKGGNRSIGVNLGL